MKLSVFGSRSTPPHQVLQSKPQVISHSFSTVVFVSPHMGQPVVTVDTVVSAAAKINEYGRFLFNNIASTGQIIVLKKIVIMFKSTVWPLLLNVLNI